MSDPVSVLRRLGEPPAVRRNDDSERCELCGQPISERHGHLVDLEGRSLMCACRGCYLLFTPEGAGGGRFRAVPDRYRRVQARDLPASSWDALQIPVSVAFFFYNSSLGAIAAFYPGPAGATESLLRLDIWQELVTTLPELASMLPDVEALLVRTAREGSEIEGFIVPIDACYELVGMLRLCWRGFDGGREASEALESFFDDVRGRVG